MADAKAEKTSDRHSPTKRTIVATGGLKQKEEDEMPEENAKDKVKAKESRDTNYLPRLVASNVTG